MDKYYEIGCQISAIFFSLAVTVLQDNRGNLSPNHTINTL
jgi:hypothetical protein